MLLLLRNNAPGAAPAKWRAPPQYSNITNGGLTAASSVDFGVPIATSADKIVYTGKFYFETDFTFTQAPTTAVVGISDGYDVTAFNRPGGAGVYATRGLSYAPNGTINRNGNIDTFTTDTFDQPAGTFNLGIAVDADANLIWLRKNGVWRGDPAAGTGGFDTFMKYGYAAMVGPTHTHTSFLLRPNTSSFTYAMPSGFTAYDDIISVAPIFVGYTKVFLGGAQLERPIKIWFPGGPGGAGAGWIQKPLKFYNGAWTST